MRGQSERSLRSRALDGILVYIRSDDRNQLFDEDLSIVRLSACKKCKIPGVTWNRIKLAMKKFDSKNINKELQKILDESKNRTPAINHLRKLLSDELS